VLSTRSKPADPTPSQKSEQAEDLRSLKSEYDYGSKKKFVDVLGNISTGAKLSAMRAQHDRESQGGLGSIRGSQRASALNSVSYKSHLTNKSKLTQASRISKGGAELGDVAEEQNE